MADGAKHAILKWINYKDANMEKLKDKIQYIADPKSSPDKYQKGYWLSEANPLHGIEVINRRWSPKGSRTFKHGIFSFGIPELTADKAFSVSDEILRYYTENYPMLMCIHTNITRRIHCHFLMGMVNARTGKKFEQSPKEFERFREHFSSVLLKNGLRPLKGATIESVNSKIELLEPAYNGDFTAIEPMNPYVLQPIVNGNMPMYYGSNPCIAQAHQPNFHVNITCDMTQVTREIMDGMIKINLMKRGY